MSAKIEKVYGVDFGGYKITTTSYSPTEGYKLYETDLGEKSLPCRIVFLEGNLGKRMIGQKAFTPSRRNVKFSITSIKDLMGKKYDDLDFENDLRLKKKNVERMEGNGIIFNINNNKLSVEHLYMMFLSKIQEIYKEEELSKEEEKDPMPIIIAVPNSYGELEKDIIKILCNRLNMNLLSIIPENLSVSVCYGYENNNSFLLEEKEVEYLLIIDIGYLYMNLTISKYEKDKCEIINDLCNDEINGKKIDELLFKHYENEIKKDFPEINTKDEVIINKIMNELIKCKCKLSADGASSINLSIDLTEDETYDGVLTVNELNSIITPLGERLKEILREFIKDSHLNEEMKKNLKILPVGGTMRIPYLQSMVIEETQEMLNPVIKMIKTLNMDECISSGNSYYGSILSGKWKYEVNYKRIENDRKNLTKDHILCLKRFNELQNEMINKRMELKDFLDLYDYLELNLSEIEMKMIENDCDDSKMKSELNYLIKFFYYCKDSVVNIKEEEKYESGYSPFAQYFSYKYLNKAKKLEKCDKDLSIIEELINAMKDERLNKENEKLNIQIKSIIKVQKEVMMNEMIERLMRINNIKDEKYKDVIKTTQLDEKSIIQTLMYITDYSKMSGEENGKSAESCYSKFHVIIKIIKDIVERNEKINILPVLEEVIDLFDDYVNKRYEEKIIKSKIENIERKIDYYSNYSSYNNKVKYLIYGYYNEIFKYENEIIKENQRINEKEYPIGEEVETLLISNGKEKWIKGIVNDFDYDRKEFSIKVELTGIKPENIRRINRRRKRKIVKHIEYNPPLSKYYVDEELGIDQPCLILSCDEYDNGEKNYNIKYQGMVKIVEGNTIESAYLPVQ